MNNDGASEVIGTVLLVGITVTVAAVFGFVILNQEGPGETQYAQIAYSLHAGADGSWSTGDEYIQLRHMGGEPFRAVDTTIRVTIGGVPTTITGAALTGGFADGKLTIGETWTYTITAAEDEDLEITTITPNQLHSDWQNTIVSGGGPTPCAPDVTSPAINSITITPADVNTDTIGTILAEAAITEACGLQYVNLTYDAGGAPVTVAMSLSGTWQATIPDLGWGALGGETLALTVEAIDTSGNSDTSSLNEAIEQIGVSFPFHDANCNGDYDVGESDRTSELADGAHSNSGECIVLPAGWGAQSRAVWDIDAQSIILEIDLTSTFGKIELRTQGGDLDMEGVTLSSTLQVRIRAELALLASNSTMTGTYIDIDEDGSSTTMDFRDATLAATGTIFDQINIRNDGTTLNAERATFTSNGDVTIRTNNLLSASFSTINAGDDITLRGFDTIEVISADHTAVDNIALTTDGADTVFVEDYCGNEDDANIPVTGIISGVPRFPGCDPLT